VCELLVHRRREVPGFLQPHKKLEEVFKNLPETPTQKEPAMFPNGYYSGF
jgi:hypothetical protein